MELRVPCWPLLQRRRTRQDFIERTDMDADIQLHGGAVLHLSDVRIEKRALTATVDGRRVSIPKDRLLGQKVLLACDRMRRGLAR
jgi:hypothetical protein